MRWRRDRSRTTAAIGDAMSKSDTIVIGGGNMIFDLQPWTRSAEHFSFLTKLAHGQDKPIAGISLGIGPFDSVSQHRAACAALDLCDALTFRDQRSLDLYLEHGRREARRAVDPVLLMDVPTSPVSKNNPLAAFNLIDPRLFGADQSTRARLLHQAVEEAEQLTLRGFDVCLFSTDRGDEAFLQDVQAQIRSARVSCHSVASLRDLSDLYTRSTLVIAARMHALIIAFVHHRPIIGLSWQAKVDSFFSLVDRPRQVLPLVHHATSDLMAHVEAALADPAAFSMSPQDRVRIDTLAQSNRDVLLGFQNQIG